VPGDRALISGVAPGAAPLRVLHLHDRDQAAAARSLAAYERSLGWNADVRPVPPLRRATRRETPAADVVVLHGRRAGLLGRLALRGTRATVLAPRPGTWCTGWSRLWEPWTAAWASAVLLADPAEAARGVRRGVWVPPFVVGDSPELQAAVLTRACAFGGPSAGLAEVPATSPARVAGGSGADHGSATIALAGAASRSDEGEEHTR
jgi:hypothetical protein